MAVPILCCMVVFIVCVVYCIYNLLTHYTNFPRVIAHYYARQGPQNHCIVTMLCIYTEMFHIINDPVS